MYNVMYILCMLWYRKEGHSCHLLFTKVIEMGKVFDSRLIQTPRVRRLPFTFKFKE